MPNLDHPRRGRREGLRFPSSTVASCAAWGVVVVAFITDWRLPADINVGAFYAVAILLAARSSDPRAVWVMALTSIFLIVLAVPLGPASTTPERPDWVIGLNRLLMGAVILMLAAISGHLIRTLRRLSELNRTLEDRVEQRTREREAALSRLHEAQKAEALGQLTAGVAHDFNNLLTIITSNLDLLRRRTDEPRLLKHVTAATEGASRAGALIDRLLTFTRRQEPHIEPVDLCALLRDLHPLLAHSVGDQVTIGMSLPEEATAWADRNRLELSILNLAVNARDAMPDGGRLDLSITSSAAEEALLCLAVSDTGAGMDEATLARATEPLFTTKPAGKGTGLGLSMAHRLAGQLGGRLDLHSTPGKGTTVAFWLRRAASGQDGRLVVAAR